MKNKIKRWNMVAHTPPFYFKSYFSRIKKAILKINLKIRCSFFVFFSKKIPSPLLKRGRKKNYSFKKKRELFPKFLPVS